ncbi:MAG: hypothetical protein AAB656_00445 [Patescibacteria group bacterium]
MAKEEKIVTAKKSNKGLIIILVVVAVLIALSLLGRYVFKSVVEKATGISEKGGSYTFKSDKGDVTFDSGTKLADSFPKDFPIYSGAKLTGSFSANGKDNSTGSFTVWESSDSSSKVGEFYKTALPSAGYKIVTDLSTEDSTTLSFEKDGVSGFLGITKDNSGKTAISVTLGTK